MSKHMCKGVHVYRQWAEVESNDGQGSDIS